MFRGETGGTSVMLGVGVFVMMLFAPAVADLGSLLLARTRAQSAADMAALAAVVRQAPVLDQGDDPETAAREASEANGARLVSCSCAVGETTATVEVVVIPRIWLIEGWRDRRVRARARAEIDPDVMTYREAG